MERNETTAIAPMSLYTKIPTAMFVGMEICIQRAWGLKLNTDLVDLVNELYGAEEEVL